MEKHMLIHKGERIHTCIACGKSFLTRNNLTVHERIHTKEKPFSCSECGESFGYKFMLNVHTQRYHTEDKLFACSICNETFGFKRLLTRHTRIYHPEVDADLPARKRRIRRKNLSKEPKRPTIKNSTSTLLDELYKMQANK